MIKKKCGSAIRRCLNPRYQMYLFVESFKQLRGDPHPVALGMAIGVFIGITPTIPLHTVLALGLAVILRASKPAAYIGIWFSNPVTIPFFYLASYKLGAFILPECSTEFSEVMSLLNVLGNGDVSFVHKWTCFSGFVEEEMDMLIAMNVGGVVIAIIPGIAAYFITYRIMSRMHSADSGNPKTQGQGAIP